MDKKAYWIPVSFLDQKASIFNGTLSYIGVSLDARKGDFSPERIALYSRLSAILPVYLSTHDRITHIEGGSRDWSSLILK
jgi:hypothetical protein